jgi:hypothetical protein
MNDNWSETLSAIVRNYHLEARIKVIGEKNPSDWGWLISPVPSCLETGDFGPFLEADIEWVEINMIRTEHRGKLVLPVMVDTSAQVLEFLKDFHHSVDDTRKIVRILPAAA